MVFHTNATVAKSLNLSSGRVAAKVSNVAVQLFSILNRYNFKSTSLAVNDISKSTDIPAHIRDRDTEFLGNLMLHKASGVKLFLDSVATHMRCREDILTTVHKNAYSLIACLGDDAIKFANGPQHDGLPGDFELPAEDYGLQVLPEEHAGQGGPVHHTIRSRLVFKDQQGDGVPLRVNNNLGLPQLMISQLNPAAAGPAAAAFASFSVDLTDPSNIPSIAIIIAGLALMRAGINVNSMPVRTHDVVSSIAQNAESSQAHAAAQAMANHQAALAALQNANNNDDDQDDQDDQDDDDDDDDDDEQP
ncbi:hypothetical protein RI054_25g104770 [Pseudoscourfieldia marina]